MPADHSRDKVEDAARVAPGEENREPGDDHNDDHGQVEEEQHDVERDGEEPLDQWQPAIEVALGVRVGKLEPHPLSLVSRRIAVTHEREVGANPVAEAQQLEVPVEPPARVLLAEHDHQ